MLAARTPPRFVTLALMAAVSVLSFNMIAPSLTAIAETFGATYARTSFAVSGFLAVTAVLTLLLGPLSDRYGRRPVLLCGVSVFCVASIGAALAQDINTFLLYRTLQATIAAGSVISSAVVRDVSEADEAASRLGYLSMAMAVAPMLAPMIGGLLDQAFGWRAVFWAYSAAGLLLLTLCWCDAGETNTQTARSFAEQFRAYPDLLLSRMFWAYALVMSCGIGAFYVFIAGAPLVAGQAYGISAATLGIGLGTITAGFFLGSFASGRVAQRIGIPRMILLGRLVPVVGVGSVLLISFGMTVPAVLFFAAAITTGIGNGLTTPSARAGSMSVRADLAGSASGLGGALIVATGAVMTQVTGMVLTVNAGVPVLLGLMLGLSVLGLALALWIRAQHSQ